MSNGNSMCVVTTHNDAGQKVLKNDDPRPSLKCETN